MRIFRAFTMCAAQKPWREAASLLLVAPTVANDQTTFSFLTMKRSGQSSFMPNGIVFPGGTVSAADSSAEWTKIFDKAGTNVREFKYLHPKAHRPEIYQVDTDPDQLPREVSLRITAIRETFEECGILLSKSIDRTEERKNAAENPRGLRDPDVITKWQKIVKDKPETFLELCDKYAVVPDLSILSEWSNFLTPCTYENRQRFDTIFYMAIVPTQLPIIIDTYEAESAEWSTPDSLVERHHGGQHQLMPPQLYEMTRLSPLHSVVYLERLLETRRRLGIERWLAVIYRTKDGSVFCLPGDDLYPEDVDATQGGVKIVTLPKTTVDVNQSTVRHHRYTRGAESSETKLIANIPPRYGHFYNEL